MPAVVTNLEVLVLRADTLDSDLDAAQETVVVQITDENGLVGIGEADSVEEAVRDVIVRTGGHGWSASLADIVIGQDPFLRGQITAELAAASFWNGPGGVNRHAIAAIDIALHDLAARQLGRPVFELLGGVRRDTLTPYATCWAPNPSQRHPLAELTDTTLGLMTTAVAAGFGAVKMELLFGDAATDRQLVECVARGRQAIGPDVDLLVDFGYRWDDWRAAARTIDLMADHDVYLVEAPLRGDNLAGYAKLAARVPARVAGAEMASTMQECRDWLEIGGVDVLQPDLARAGGFTGMADIARLAGLYGATVVPHCWRTGINAAAARHFHAATSNVPMIEFLAPGFSPSPLRATLVGPEPTLENGVFALPRGAGLGVELDDEVVASYRVT